MQGAIFTQPGKQTLKLPCGTIYDIQLPGGDITGLMSQNKRYVTAGTLIVTDLVNNIEATVYYDCNEPKRRGFLGGWIGGGHDNKEGEVSKNREDLVRIEICKIPKKSKADIISIGEGSYLEKIAFDNKPPVWDVNMKG